MKTTMWKMILAVAAQGLVCLSARAVVQYTVMDLGLGTAYCINNNSQVVGTSRGYATLFDPTGQTNNRNLGNGTAWCISDNGQIVGSYYNGSVESAYLYDPTGNGRNTYLKPCDGKPNCWAGSINSQGQIVGESWDGISGYATLFDATGCGNGRKLGLGLAYSINDSGRIVGQAVEYVTHYSWAASFDPAGSESNTILGRTGGTYAEALFINNNGQIVGSSVNSAGHVCAAVFDPTGNGNNTSLGTTGGTYSVASSINNSGQIVGYTIDSTYHVFATLFDATGQGNNVNLNTLIDPASGWTLQQALSINDNGWIVGSGTNAQGQRDAFVLIPVPEPASLALIAMAGLWSLRPSGKHRITRSNA